MPGVGMQKYGIRLLFWAVLLVLVCNILQWPIKFAFIRLYAEIDKWLLFFLVGSLLLHSFWAATLSRNTIKCACVYRHVISGNTVVAWNEMWIKVCFIIWVLKIQTLMQREFILGCKYSENCDCFACYLSC